MTKTCPSTALAAAAVLALATGAAACGETDQFAVDLVVERGDSAAPSALRLDVESLAAGATIATSTIFVDSEALSLGEEVYRVLVLPETGADVVRIAISAFDTVGNLMASVQDEIARSNGVVSRALALAATSDCGNEVAEGREECDGGDLGGLGCADFGDFVEGTPSCREDCTIDASPCISIPECGDGEVVAPEDCDGSNLDGQTCVGLGYTAGTLACLTTCAFDLSGCTPQSPMCGDGVAANSEACDGDDLQGRDCTHLGCTGGTIACDSECAYDLSGCTGC